MIGQGLLCDALAAMDDFQSKEQSEEQSEEQSKEQSEEQSQEPGAHGGPAPTEAGEAIVDGQASHLQALRALGIEQLVDAHSHWFPESVERKIWRYFAEHHWNVAYRGSLSQRLEWMHCNGVARFTVLTYAHRPAMAQWLNEWVAGFAAETPQAIPCGTFYPEPEADAVVRRCIEEYRFRGFKLHLQVSAFDPNESVLEGAFEQIVAAGLPVVIHCGNGPVNGTYTSPVYLQRLLERHPRLKVVVAHMGAFQFETYLQLLENHPNLYLDTTMVFVGFDACGQYPEHCLERLSAHSERVLFGSDFPAIPYTLTHAVEGILSLPFSAEQKKGILRENATRLFGA